MTDLDVLLVVITVDGALASGDPMAGGDVHIAVLGMTARSGSG